MKTHLYITNLHIICGEMNTMDLQNPLNRFHITRWQYCFNVGMLLLCYTRVKMSISRWLRKDQTMFKQQVSCNTIHTRKNERNNEVFY